MAHIPEAVAKALEKIEEGNGGSVKTHGQSSATITIGTSTFELSRAECKKFFQSQETVDSLFEAIGRPDNAILELYGIGLDVDIQDQMNELFASVSES